MGRSSHNIPVGATALVTGASSGIGLQFSHALASMGINVMLVSNRSDELESAYRTLQAEYPHLHFYSLYKDLTDADSAQFILDYCHSSNIDIDILINNAGVFAFREVADMTESHINLFVNLHIRAVTQLCRTFALDMRHRDCKGYILNMSSMSCWMPMPGIAMYSATKAYIRVLSRSMYLELKECGISVTVACPGGIATDLFGLPRNLQRLGVRLGVLATPKTFVCGALRKMFNRKKQYINGFINRIAIVAVSLLPSRARLIVKHQMLDKNVTR